MYLRLRTEVGVMLIVSFRAVMADSIRKRIRFRVVRVVIVRSLDITWTPMHLEKVVNAAAESVVLGVLVH